ncbi:MAG: hypothetical protein HYY85_10765 [Deltaproteobacteria bacterium]|nr:hypothetical protein [Deltaproteobacteria bacterium]
MRRWLDTAERQAALDYLAGRFGIAAEAFADHELLDTGSGIWAVAQSPRLREALALLPTSAGLRVLRRTAGGFKPTTYGLQRFGVAASRNVVDLAEPELGRLLRGEALEGPFPAEPGYVILRCEGWVVGCGLYKQGRLLSQIPASRAKEVRLTPPF